MSRLLLRLQLCPSFFIFALASSLMMAYELLEPALTSYGGSFDSPVLGIHLPAVILLSESVSKASTPWLIGGVAAGAGVARVIDSRYLHLCATKTQAPHNVAADILWQGIPLSLLYASITLAPSAFICLLACKSSFSPQTLASLSLQGVIVATEHPLLTYSGLFLAFYSKCLFIFSIVRAALLWSPLRKVAPILPPILWLTMSFTPLGSISPPSATAAFSLSCLTSYSPMAHLRLPGTMSSFLASFLAWCTMGSALLAAFALLHPSSLVVQSKCAPPSHSAQNRQTRKERQ